MFKMLNFIPIKNSFLKYVYLSEKQTLLHRNLIFNVKKNPENNPTLFRNSNNYYFTTLTQYLKTIFIFLDIFRDDQFSFYCSFLSLFY